MCIRDSRRRVPARKAAHLALGETFPSLLVSAGILATAGFALGFSSSMSAVSSLGFLLARGALLSLTLVTCFLPALLVLLDRVIQMCIRDSSHGLPCNDRFARGFGHRRQRR